MDPKNNRPDLEGNNETSAAGGGTAGGGAAAVMAAERGGEANPAPPTRQASDAGTAGFVDAQEGFVPYATAGKAFTSWFNAMLTRTPNPVIRLGTKSARVETLHDDGRLAVQVQGEGGREEQQYVAFDPAHLDALLLKFASAAR